MAHKSVGLRGMLTQNSAATKVDEIKFIDEDVEKGETIYLFLKACCGELRDNIPILDEDGFCAYPRFISKWDCPAQIELLNMFIRPIMLDDDPHEERVPDPFSFMGDKVEIFTIGAILGDIDVCYLCIRHGIWRTRGLWLYEGHNDEPTLDLRGATEKYLDHIPQKYFRALLRAQMGMDLLHSKDWEAIAKDFRCLMLV